jgi:hypothetical protein
MNTTAETQRSQYTSTARIGDLDAADVSDLDVLAGAAKHSACWSTETDDGLSWLTARVFVHAPLAGPTDRRVVACLVVHATTPASRYSDLTGYDYRDRGATEAVVISTPRDDDNDAWENCDFAAADPATVQAVEHALRGSEIRILLAYAAEQVASDRDRQIDFVAY